MCDCTEVCSLLRFRVVAPGCLERPGLPHLETTRKHAKNQIEMTENISAPLQRLFRAAPYSPRHRCVPRIVCGRQLLEMSTLL